MSADLGRAPASGAEDDTVMVEVDPDRAPASGAEGGALR
jgi:hypothetical protein